MQQSTNLSNHLLLLVLTLLTMCPCGCGPRPEVVAQVGETAITAKDVAYHQAVAAARSGEELPPHLALLQLVQEGIMIEVGWAFDVVVSEEMLAEEAARVQATSRDPKTLARVRAVFGDDESAYRHLVLRPTLINQLLHARFSLGHDIQAEPLARAQELLAAALTDPSGLPVLAETFGAEYRQLTIVGGQVRFGDGSFDGAQDAALPSALAQYNVEWPDYDREFVEQVVEGLAVGELYPAVVEDRYSFMVVRLLLREGADAALESAVIPKLAFDPWFHTQSQRVLLTIRDQALKAALLAEVDLPYITDRLSVGE